MLPRKVGRRTKHYSDWIIQGRVSWLEQMGVTRKQIYRLQLDRRMTDMGFAALSGPLVGRWERKNET